MADRIYGEADGAALVIPNPEVATAFPAPRLFTVGAGLVVWLVVGPGNVHVAMVKPQMPVPGVAAVESTVRLAVLLLIPVVGEVPTLKLVI